jgi:hypothetical protein
MLASSDQTAIDAVAAKMMGFDPMSIEYIRVAHEDGLGVGDSYGRLARIDCCCGRGRRDGRVGRAVRRRLRGVVSGGHASGADLVGVLRCLRWRDDPSF